MNLIIYAHPDTEGYCKEILKEIKKKVDWEVLDLYKMKYDPVLHEEELYTKKNSEMSKLTKKIQNKIKKADKLIFIYPNWWNSPPAILKGFVDKIFTSHFAFEYRNKIPVGLLKGKKAAIFATTGATRALSIIFQGDRFIKIMSKDVLKFCGIKSRAFVIDKAFSMDDKQKKRIKQKVKEGLEWLG